MNLKTMPAIVALCALALPAHAFNYGFLSQTVLAKLTREDIRIGTEATVRALNEGVGGNWSNPATGASGEIKILKTLDVDGYAGCRQTRLDVAAGGTKGGGTYVLCKRNTGKWAFYKVSKY